MRVSTSAPVLYAPATKTATNSIGFWYLLAITVHIPLAYVMKAAPLVAVMYGLALFAWGFFCHGRS